MNLIFSIKYITQIEQNSCELNGEMIFPNTKAISCIKAYIQNIDCHIYMIKYLKIKVNFYKSEI